MKISVKELKERINSGEKLLVKFYGDFCAPCKTMDIYYNEASEILKNQESDVTLYSVNITDDIQFILDLGIKSVPTTKSYKDTINVTTITGLLQTDKILELVNEIK